MNSFTLAKYCLRHIGFWFLVVWAVIIAVLLCGDIFEMVRRTSGSARLIHILTLSSLKIVGHTAHFLPFIAFIAARLSFWRLQKRREITAFASLGVSRYFLMRLCGVATLFISLLHLCVLQPTSAALQEVISNYEYQWLNQRNHYRFALVTSGLWLRESNELGYRIVKAKNVAGSKLQNIHVYEWSYNKRLKLYVEAQEASLHNKAWHLKNVKIFASDGSVNTYDTYQLQTKLTWNNIVSSQIDPRSLSIWKVDEWLPLLKQVGVSEHPYLMQWHRHMAQAGLTAALLLFALVLSSFPLSFMLSGLIVYFANDVVQALGQAQHLPMVLAAWCISLVVLLLSMGWLVHSEEKL